MARSSRTGGKTNATKTRKASSAKDRNSAKAKRCIPAIANRTKHTSASNDPGKELKKAREQQAAIADVLKVIASSPCDVQPVFDAIAASANRLIGGLTTAVFLFTDGMVHLKGLTLMIPEGDDALKSTFPRKLEDHAPAQIVQRARSRRSPIRRRRRTLSTYPSSTRAFRLA